MKKILLIITILLSLTIFQTNIEAAIAYDTSSASGLKTTAQTKTWLHTCTGSDLILFVGFFGKGTDNITGVTYNSVAMTFVNKIQLPSDRYIHLYYLIAPDTGEHSVLVSEDPVDYLSGFSVSYTGVRQSSQPDDYTTKSQASTASMTTTVTTVADNCWTILLVKKNATGQPVAGTGSTLRQEANDLGIFDSNGVHTPAGEADMEVTFPSSSTFVSVMASFAPVAAEPPVADNAIMFGMDF